MGKSFRSVDDLAPILQALQSQGKTVVYGSGLFDLVHGEHARALRNAKSRGDFLVLGVHEDAIVKRRIDPGLPIHSTRDRVELLEALEPVDYVVVLRADDAGRTIETLGPDILVTGIDENPDASAEEATAKGMGKKIVTLAPRSGSTLADTLRKIRRLADSGSRTSRSTRSVTPGSGRKAKTRSGSKSKSKAEPRGKAKGKGTTGTKKKTKARAKTKAKPKGKSAAKPRAKRKSSRASKTSAPRKSRSHRRALAGAS
jgi:D-beta-D-heptose 7-phosphate kinase/D-beta-D-heptose 1-phosphate adenosyltransferase